MTDQVQSHQTNSEMVQSVPPEVAAGTDVALKVNVASPSAHVLSIAVSDVPSPIAFGDEFRIKIGVKCSAECDLTDQKIEIYDHEGSQVVTATLSHVPGEAETALYRAEVKLTAPNTQGRYRWTVQCPKPDLELAHEGASNTFAFATARQPEHVVTIQVVHEGTQTPIPKAHVLLRPILYKGYAYTTHTDDAGVARVSVPTDDYQLYIRGLDKDTLLPTVTVTSDVTIQAELAERRREFWEF